MTQGDLVTVIGRHYLTVTESGEKQVLINLTRATDTYVLTVPEKFVTFAKTMTAPAPPASSEEVTGRDDTVRKSYYGSTDVEQPWDTMRRKGWGATFSSSNVLKYLRRTKNPDDLDKARWYWIELNKMVNNEMFPAERAHAMKALYDLTAELTEDEMKRLIPLSEFPEGALDTSLIKK